MSNKKSLVLEFNSYECFDEYQGGLQTEGTNSIKSVVESIIAFNPSLKKQYPKGIKIGTRIKITLLDE